MKKSFTDNVLDVARRIPRGHTRSYAEVARLAGNPRAYRAVGTIMRKNKDPRVPCHRVIRSNGAVGGYNRGIPEKIKRLSKEGVVLKK